MIEMSEESEDEAVDAELYLEHCAELLYDFAKMVAFPWNIL
jgi:hypothetical protein